ncbi:sulfate permease [Pochonia chlamydosporia 170]|uniref:Sulfate permease n=1 Tax=Pochonia chlamydosporia 170 TaxID=1380566 RepID=A0A179EZZ1_METCM|nr:sulfate permease [Pochonia chlamydosporia 170]OAQ58764.1 sulfate permease [Pochonia chlamydosporia 170]
MGNTLAKSIAIRLGRREEPHDLVESTTEPNNLFQAYVETKPTVVGYIKEHLPTKTGTVNYVYSLFPFLSWIFHYNTTWLLGDITAGVTVGFVVVPQAMAYALQAQLSPEYGLYTSFIAMLLYWAFATSKDITIGAVAVMSTLVGNIIVRVRAEYPEFTPDQISRGLALISGTFLLIVGLIRVGWIVEFIPLVSITSFMTGAAISIAAGQVPALMGISGINTREAASDVIINTLKGLPRTKIDAVMGLSALFLLYSIRCTCNYMATRQSSRKRLWFFVSTLRLAFVILLYTLVSFLINRGVTNVNEAKFKILGNVPRGFQKKGVPDVNTKLLKAIAPELPATIIVLIIEHIAISKSFGRVNNYTINPSQELVAIGLANLFGPFLGAYPATGSFSRTAIKSKAVVRTPLAGIFTSIIVLLALYALTSVFFYIPMSNTGRCPPDFLIFLAGILMTIFTSLENGVYLTIASAAALLLIRIARAKGSFLGRVRIYAVSAGDLNSKKEGSERPSRDAFLSIMNCTPYNEDVEAESPYPGVFIFRFDEGFNYTNQQHYLDKLLKHVQKETRPTQLGKRTKLGDRPWNDPGPRRGEVNDLDDSRPILRAIVLDCSSVNSIDITSVQGLVDVRNVLNQHSYPASAEWHFANLNNRWTRRAFAAAGFGYPSTGRNGTLGQWKPIFSVAAIETGNDNRRLRVTGCRDEENCVDVVEIGPVRSEGIVAQDKLAAIHGVNRPFFHVDLTAAVESAVANATNRDANISK